MIKKKIGMIVIAVLCSSFFVGCNNKAEKIVETPIQEAVTYDEKSAVRKTETIEEIVQQSTQIVEENPSNESKSDNEDSITTQGGTTGGRYINGYELLEDNAGYYTPVYSYNHDHPGGYQYNTVRMLIKKTDDYDTYSNNLKEMIEAAGGYVNGGSGFNYGDGYDNNEGPYYIDVDYLSLEQQFFEVRSAGGSCSYILNFDYLPKNYGIEEDVTWSCMAYHDSSFYDASLGVRNELTGSITYDLYEVVEIYRQTEEFYNSDIGKLPSINQIILHSVRGEFPENGGVVYAYYYLYMADDSDELPTELDQQLYQKATEEPMCLYEYEESISSYGQYQEGEVFIKRVYYPTLDPTNK